MLAKLPNGRNESCGALKSVQASFLEACTRSRSCQTVSVFCGDSCVQQATLIPLYPSHPHVHIRIHVCVIASHNTLHYPGLGASILAKSFLTPAHRPPVSSAAPARIRHRPSIIPYAVCRNPKQCVPPHPSSHATASLMSCTPTSSSSQESTKCSPAITSSHRNESCGALKSVQASFLAACTRSQSCQTAATRVVEHWNRCKRRFWRLAHAREVAKRPQRELWSPEIGASVVSGGLHTLAKLPNGRNESCGALKSVQASFLAACTRSQSCQTAATRVVEHWNRCKRRFWRLAHAREVAKRPQRELWSPEIGASVVSGGLHTLAKLPNGRNESCGALKSVQASFLAACTRSQSCQTAATRVVEHWNRCKRRFWRLAHAREVAKRPQRELWSPEIGASVVSGGLHTLAKLPNGRNESCGALESVQASFLAACTRSQSCQTAATRVVEG